MLNRAKRHLIIAALAGTMCLVLPCFAVNESTISYITINDKVYEDVEIMLGNGQEILVPFKQLAAFFEIQFNANRIDKVIHFTTYDGLSGVITENNVVINNQVIQLKHPIFLREGIMDNTYNEAFIETSTAERIFGIKLVADYSSLTISADISRDLQILHTSKNDWQEDKGPKAHPDAVLPKRNGVISLNRIGVRNNLVNDNMSTRTTYDHYINDTVSGNTAFGVVGDAFGGKYYAEANMFHYRQDAFMFGGVSATYKNKFKNKKDNKDYYYELGRVKGRSDIDAAIGTNIFGAQVWNYNYAKELPNELNGYVKPTSMVQVSVNGGEPVAIDTYAGYWSLKSFPFPPKVETVRIEEINEDGTVEFVREERFQLYGDRPFENEERGSVYAGVWGYQNRLFREGANIYRGNNKKATAGADYQKGIKDNVTFESKLTADKIYEKKNAHKVFAMPTSLHELPYFPRSFVQVLPPTRQLSLPLLKARLRSRRRLSFVNNRQAVRQNQPLTRL